ncbi:MAG: cytochrome c-type biogenesis protein CcmH [Armatimonadota bacterium]|nr:cytochrome c-type biogenesis protein CcmH [Armatimonadota bacterium]MDR7451451.1 cytochrome c-type biogenesis protein CcmH [Armatimonadota bacterium]MDR7466399.1 cytochrome c-type biogenesis protein CcmH [Armatimonadota bacterium]MDR7493121.1 cytochrome c-type biogenesis protein CcmH [Armatimonadota bacterium]MDR7498122.1 cytochrome c-type biogenesis protein CcmH [Armatimonadota bacterium]
MRILVLIAALTLTLAAHPSVARGADRGLAGEFMCQCGCGLTLASCTHLSCGPRDAALAELASLERAGRSRAEIRAAFVARYGERVLAAPLRRGFNLLAYWGPYWAIGSGALVIVALALAWTRRGEGAGHAAAPALSREQREWLERQLRALED